MDWVQDFRDNHLDAPVKHMTLKVGIAEKDNPILPASLLSRVKNRIVGVRVHDGLNSPGDLASAEPTPWRPCAWAVIEADSKGITTSSVGKSGKPDKPTFLTRT